MHELLFWGMFGLTIEISFTAFRRLLTKRKIDLIGHTSLWMFPIYAFGLTYGVDFLISKVPNELIRYSIYPFLIWAVEILVGYPTSKLGIKIWDYHYLPDKYHWKGIVSFAHYPLWVLFGILVEIINVYAQ